jgi:hypothetical protein
MIVFAFYSPGFLALLHEHFCFCSASKKDELDKENLLSFFVFNGGLGFFR